MTAFKSSAARHSAFLFLFSMLAAACSDSGGADRDNGVLPDEGSETTPTVTDYTPSSGATDVSRNTSITVTFSEPMNPATVGATTFTVSSGTPSVLTAGTILYSGTTATFWPAEFLAVDTTYTVLVTTAATSAAGVALAANNTWTFTTGDSTSAGSAVPLRSAGEFVILSQAGISSVPDSEITGDIAVSPGLAVSITDFALSADATNTFSMSDQVVGRVYASDYAVPTPALLTAAVSDMTLAYQDAAARPANSTNLGDGNIGGMSVARGVYRFDTGLIINSDVTLIGSATDVWVFQVAGNLTIGSGANVVLSGGALPENVFWQVAGLVELDTTAHCEGTILSASSIALRTGASIDGRLMAGTAVTLDQAVVTEPN
ncbi:MAG: DUF3494 domain-containing protein [Sandaracinaceae bacterium]|nr:DUF3494 domain-containing protein [Sandaracinaceae bacterium]